MVEVAFKSVPQPAATTFAVSSVFILYPIIWMWFVSGPNVWRQWMAKYDILPFGDFNIFNIQKNRLFSYSTGTGIP